MGMRWFTSDPHFGHANIIDYANRPFFSVGEMDAAMVARWSERVAPDDEVWVIGDLALGHYDDSILHRVELPGKKFLVPGNHDRCWPGGKKNWREWKTRYEDDFGFTVVTHEPGEAVEVGPFQCCHFPPTRDRYGRSKFDAWLPDLPHGALLAHGHVHELWRTYEGRPWVNVGVDVWDFYPVSEERLLVALGR